MVGGFAMGLAKGFTPSGKPQKKEMTLAEKIALKRTRSADVEFQQEGALAVERQKGINSRNDIRLTESEQGPRLERMDKYKSDATIRLEAAQAPRLAKEATQKHVTGPVKVAEIGKASALEVQQETSAGLLNVEKEKSVGILAKEQEISRRDVKLKGIPDATVLATNKYNTDQQTITADKLRKTARSDTFLASYRARVSKNKKLYGPRYETKPTFHEWKAMKDAPDSNGYFYLDNKGWLGRQALKGEESKANEWGWIIGKGGENGGFALKTRITERANAVASYRDDVAIMQSYKTASLRGSTEAQRREASEKYGILLTKAADGSYQLAENAPRPVRKSLERANSYILPNGTNIEKIIDLYAKDFSNKENYSLNRGTLLSPKEIVNKEAFIPRKTTKEPQRIKTDVSGPAVSIIMAEPGGIVQFDGRPGSKQYKEVEANLAKGIDVDLYNKFKERAIRIYSDLSINRYNGAVNFRGEKVKALKGLKGLVRTGKVKNHVVGFEQQITIKDASYLEGKTPNIPQGKALDIIVKTAMAEGRNLGRENIDNIDHIFEVIRNREFHPDFKNQRKPRATITELAPKTAKTVSAISEEARIPAEERTLDTIKNIAFTQETLAEQVKVFETRFKEKSAEITVGSVKTNPRGIVEAAIQDGGYGDVLGLSDYKHELAEYKKDANSKPTLLANALRLKLKSYVDKARSEKIAGEKLAAVNKRNLKDQLEPVIIDGSPTDSNGNMIPPLQSKEGARITLKGLIERAGGTATSLDAAHQAVADLGRFESWIIKIKAMSAYNTNQKKRLIAGFVKSYDGQIGQAISNLSNYKSFSEGTHANIRPENFPNLTGLAKDIGTQVLHGAVIDFGLKYQNAMITAFQANKKFFESPQKSRTGKIIFMKGEMQSSDGKSTIDFYTPVNVMSQADLDKKGRFAGGERLYPNKKGDMTTENIGEFSSEASPNIRLFSKDYNFEHKNNPEREARIRGILAPIKKEMDKIISAGGGEIKDYNKLVDLVMGSKELKKEFPSLTASDLISSMVNAGYHKYMDTAVLAEGNVNAAGIKYDTQGTKPGMEIRKPSEIANDLNYKDAQKVEQSGTIVMSYLHALDATYLQGGMNSGKLSAFPEEHQQMVFDIMQKFRQDPQEYEKMLTEAFPDKTERENIKRIFKEQGALRQSGVGTFMDKLMVFGQTTVKYAETILSGESNYLRDFLKNNVFGAGVRDIDSKAPLFLTKGRRDKLTALEDQRTVITDKLRNTLDNKDSTSKMKIDAILTARRNFYAIALTYHFAGMVQGGSGGRAISNEDFENLYKALWGSGGELQVHNVQRAMAIARNALQRARIIKSLASRPGGADFVLNYAKPLIEALRLRQERSALPFQAKVATRSSNPSIFNAQATIYRRFLQHDPSSTNLKGLVPHGDAIAANKRLDGTIDAMFETVDTAVFNRQINELNAGTVRTYPPSKKDPYRETTFENITAKQFYRLLDNIGRGQKGEKTVSQMFDETLERFLNASSNKDLFVYNSSGNYSVQGIPPHLRANGKDMAYVFHMAKERGPVGGHFAKIKGHFITNLLRTFSERKANPKVEDQEGFGM
jgi:hypothetical protein